MTVVNRVGNEHFVEHGRYQYWKVSDEESFINHFIWKRYREKNLDSFMAELSNVAK